MHTETVNVEGIEILLETGKIAKQAGGAVVARCGGTMVLVAACGAADFKADQDFFPLTVDYIEKTFAAGKFPGGFFKREGRPRELELLTSRLIDRSIRPLFPDGYRSETQIVATVLSHDQQTDSGTLGLTGASAALVISDIPFNGPIAGVRVGRLGGRLVVNPTVEQIEKSDLNIVMAASRDSIAMVEGGAGEVEEEVVVEALLLGHRAAQPLIDAQLRMREAVGMPKRELVPTSIDPRIVQAVAEFAGRKISGVMTISQKLTRYKAIAELEKGAVEAAVEALGHPACEEEGKKAKRDAGRAFHDLMRSTLRGKVLAEGVRIDGRRGDEIRTITCEVGVLPRVHGSALFTRGETQALVTTTLGTSQDEQKIEDLTGEDYKRFMLHYNFPPFSVGEVKRLSSPSRREIGHGALAERALGRVIPDEKDFMYTIRVVSEILESNGSSSMASICGGSLSLMDAGVPIKSAMAGIAMGLIKEGDRVMVLSDILGDEDHLGDMDFKVAGTRKGVTALQMDIKCSGLGKEILSDALRQAREGRLFILDRMDQALDKPRSDLSKYAPRIITIFIRTERIKDVIGPGGKMIRDIIARTGVSIDVEDDGAVHIASADGEAAEKAIRIIKDITAEPEVGKIYLGKVVAIKDFGAFVEILPGTDGLLHISEISNRRLEKVTDVLKEGDEVMVKVTEIGKDGRIRLSRREAMEEQAKSEKQSDK